MTEPDDILYEHIGQSLESFQWVAEQLDELLHHGADLLTEALLNDGKILVCGMGSSAALGQGFATGMLSRFDRERPGLPVLALSGDGSLMSGISYDTNPNDIFARQVRTLGHEQDVLLAISASGKAPAVIKAVQAAHDMGLCVVALTGPDGGDIATLLEENDVELSVSGATNTSLQLTHHLILNCLGALIEHQLFGSEL
ncbi:MAG: SIS domain-containing protein [Saccharospirillum sp.]|jgi:phosphoheptose isomerase|uniref:D-sedoheptulose-7-phosphate isomerase n=1 Tax=Saccharospirillum TaxID=231683 RepID=UPI000FDB94D7|nr:SIS domain-containing protein [Saccharospirillum alexandrii]